MVVAGIDAGARNVQVVLLRGGAAVGAGERPSGHDAPEAARALLVDALAAAGLGRGEVRRVVATGSWQERIECHGRLSEAEALARGAVHLVPGARTAIEVGAEEARAVRLDERGDLEDVVTAEACAAGAGIFAETLARLLGVAVEDLGALSLQSTGAAEMRAQCVVFAEREAVALLREGEAAADIARAVHEGIAGRVGSLVRRLGFREPVVLVGGLAHDQGFAHALGTELELEALHVPGECGYCGALGAALAAASRRA